MERDYAANAMAAQVGLSNAMAMANVGMMKAAPPATRAETLLSRLDVLSKQLREVRSMTFAATERLLGAEPSPINQGINSIAGTEQRSPFMAQTENAIGDLERVVSEIREELGRINRTFG